ncbi:tetratricopeptide repeat protein [uncultured Roseovarius sp.]|uniref:tetratricopeptide repeat protein n=1 Tax=uncultured Roseovarius sp. TaxID=293344 RepID=UPI0025D825D3|nr:tetratricopeptide repeat protein [uncultured Roseovarius sp.]
MELSAAGGLVAVLLFVWAIITKPFAKPKPTQLAPDTIDQIKPPQAKDGPALTVPEFIRLRRELKADLEAELAEAAEAEKSQLRARIAELEKQIANPDEALAEAQKRIKDLEALLDREANQIGADRIAEAKAALEQGDYSLADDIFAEIEAKNELAVQETARAAFGRGEVAEAEVRWGDAYTHYKRATDLHETFDHLSAYARMTWRLAKGAEAIPLHEKLVDWVKSDHGVESAEYAIRLNNLALVVEAQGRYAEAEGLYRVALEIDRATIGEGHPDYAIHLSNLAGVLHEQERNGEAEGLYREALEIGRATIGTGHPDYATRLNNLAVTMQAQGRTVEAEALFRETLEVTRNAVGERHPHYANRLNNLARFLVEQGKPEEARPLYEQALEILRVTLPPDHPHIALVEGHIAKLS